MKPEDIIGKTITFEYSSETYKIEVLSESQIRWTRTRGEGEGATDVEAYISSPLIDKILIITWIEADGLGLSNVLNFDNMRLTTHANMNRDVFENSGHFTIN